LLQNFFLKVRNSFPNLTPLNKINGAGNIGKIKLPVLPDVSDFA